MKLETYREASAPLPASYRAWQLFGAGFENVGKDGSPVSLALRPPGDGEILIRVDALGICYSDIKVINQGGQHARLRGRDLAADPTVLGHECACTVVAAGARWADQFPIGSCHTIQADIFSGGENFAFGYQIPGGLAEYSYLDERVLAGDEGCYLLPIPEGMGYSQAALTEPWACVERSYGSEERLELKSLYQLVICGDDAPFAEQFPTADYSRNNFIGKYCPRTYDDIVCALVEPRIVEEAAQRLKQNGVMFVLGPPACPGDVTLDIGAIHYQGKRVFGGGATVADVAAAHRRTDLRPGGSALFLGGGGPMGQMHVQRAIEREHPPRRIVVTGLTHHRLDHLKARFTPLAQSKGCQLITVASGDFADHEAMIQHLLELEGEGFDDVVVLAPSVQLVEDAVRLAADGGLVNVFAGLVIGTLVKVPIEVLCTGVTLYGTSGSRIADMRRVLDKVSEGRLDTNRIVAAIGGLDAARDGLAAVKDATYHGKVVIYPQIPSLPLQSVEEAARRIPGLKEALTSDGAWTIEAERILLETYLP